MAKIATPSSDKTKTGPIGNQALFDKKNATRSQNIGTLG
jgi:hypothetical protein